FAGDIIRKTKSETNNAKNGLNYQHEFVLLYAKDINNLFLHGDYKDFTNYKNPDNDINGIWIIDNPSAPGNGKNNSFEIKNPYTQTVDLPPKGRSWAFSKSRFEEWVKTGKIVFKKDVKSGERGFILKKYLSEVKSNYKQVDSLFATDNKYMNQAATKELNNLLTDLPFTYPKPLALIYNLIKYSTNKNDIVLDFFAGSGTTGHAVMKLNAEDNGNRKFILCQKDEPVKQNENAYKFCIDNNLPPLISSITCERLKRAGNAVKEESSTVDTGYKVFDLTTAPYIDLKDTKQIELFDNRELTALDRIYNMIFKIGVDNPVAAPKEILKDCLYLCEETGKKNYYITNSREFDKEENRNLFKKAAEEGIVYIDGWTASINTTLQEYKGHIEIIF
ncbi:MAG: hypothetical protein LBL71_01655, partial [Endomicrobium sp.]|nr:hypothetical protein [Endomicrobium sp.]